ncbi:MAG: ATP-dependent DNA helicase RecG [Verrucomicrobia bacterium]|nr:MAG: ATP-dependent DNA helicase RecG [Verrucomicrobiota bacterium]
MAEFRLDLGVADLPGVSARQAGDLVKLGIVTVEDLLHHFPRRYEDRRTFDQWPAMPMPHPVCIRGQVKDTKTHWGGRSGGRFDCILEPVEETALAGPIVLSWFNMPFMNKTLAAGMELSVFGQPQLSGSRLVMFHPDYEILEDAGVASLHMDRIVPIHPAGAGVKPRFLRTQIDRILARLDELPIEPVLPPGLMETLVPGLAGIDRRWAFREIHFPTSMEDMARAEEYLALEEFVAQQIQVLRGKQAMEAQPGEAHAGPGFLLGDFLADLPYAMTGAQQRCLAEIRADLERESPMNRLLQGDVGAGKTLVAFSAMLLAVEAGFQAAIMAPTQILAEQHYLNFVKQAAKLDLRISLRTSDRTDNNFAGGLFGADDAQIVVGTHSLIYDKVKFKNLGLIVIDEQHKFGVDQRGRLADQGRNPDILVMTATPIPRTLTMTVYGDLDVSVLDELPKGRGKIVTRVRPDTKIKEAIAFVLKNLEEGRQAYVVYPLVEQTGKTKALSATSEFDKWRESLPGFECALLHGKLHPKDKDRIMARFRDNEVQVLVATTVIEVGVDVPNANVMLIFSAERFGLAQLHQLRGRVGRGAHNSYCVLMYGPGQEEAAERLKLLEETRDGFRIAEEDLKIRGPGDVLGTRQSGLPDLRFARMLVNHGLVQKAREVASRIIDQDPDLCLPAHLAISERVERLSRAAAGVV